jgi:peptide/nickel transport system ATP-binding protein
MCLLDVQNLCVTLRSENELIHAVDNISFRLEKGKTFCLVGESGSGKSITALSLIQLLPQYVVDKITGKLNFENTTQNHSDQQSSVVDILRLEEQQLCQIRGARIAMIFQEPMSSLNPVFTIGEQIVETLQLHHPDMSDEAAQHRALDVLRQVKMPQLEQRFNQYPHHLSGGQRQRVMIAMALACEPDLLIADEPTTALDVTIQAEILKLMRDLQTRIGMSILFITHDFGVVAQMADQVGVMQQGKLVEVGTMQQVLRNPQHAYSKKLLASLPENLPRIPSQARPMEVLSDMSLKLPLIEVKKLKVWFPIKKGILQRTVDYVRAVDNVNFTLSKGEIVALVGESGCGKTTLGRSIVQLETVTSGSIKMRGKELVGLSQRQLKPLRPKMQIAFQDPQSSLNPRLHIVTTLTEPMKVHGIGLSDEERVEIAAQVLKKVHLKREYLWRYPHEFSGGQRQRIGLARALILNPDFIVCDEITSALDVSVQAEILQLLLEIRQQQELALIFITHNIAVVEYLSDQILVMHQGKIVERGKTAEVCGNPQHAYTQRLLSAVPRQSDYF